MKEQLSREQYFASLAKKPMAAGALIRNIDERILLVKPTYRDTWDIPGGTLENKESPRTGCWREVKEEIGLDLQLGRLLVTDWRVVDDVDCDIMLYVYDGGRLTEYEVSQIKFPRQEIAEARMFQVEEGLALVKESVRLRVRHALDALKWGETFELEMGKRVSEQEASDE